MHSFSHCTYDFPIVKSAVRVDFCNLSWSWENVYQEGLCSQGISKRNFLGDLGTLNSCNNILEQNMMKKRKNPIRGMLKYRRNIVTWKRNTKNYRRQQKRYSITIGCRLSGSWLRRDQNVMIFLTFSEFWKWDVICKMNWWF